MGIMGLYNDYCCSNFGLRYYVGYQFWILRFFQPPADDFYDQYSIVMAGNQSLSSCSCGLIDFRDLSFLNHSEAFQEVVEHSFTQLEVKNKYAVLCNTPIESAFFYLLQQKAAKHNISFGLFSSMEAALEYLQIPADPIFMDEQFLVLGKNYKGSDSSNVRSVAI
ncbi:MAG: hypothetical protein ACWA6U_14860 [Breznakibacter sp.]